MSNDDLAGRLVRLADGFEPFAREARQDGQIVNPYSAAIPLLREAALALSPDASLGGGDE